MKKLNVVGYIIGVILLFVVLTGVFHYVQADAGNINRYTGGSSSSSSSDSDSEAGFVYIIYLLFRLIAIIPLPGWMKVILIIGVVVGVCFLIKKSNGSNREPNNGIKINKGQQKHEPKLGFNMITTPSEKLLQCDPNVKEEELLEQVKQYFIEIQTAFTELDASKLKEFETDLLYQKHVAYIEECIHSQVRKNISELLISYANITSYKVKGITDMIEVYLKVTMKSEMVDQRDQQVIQGDIEVAVTDGYQLQLIRNQENRNAWKLSSIVKVQS